VPSRKSLQGGLEKKQSTREAIIPTTDWGRSFLSLWGKDSIYSKRQYEMRPREKENKAKKRALGILRKEDRRGGGKKNGGENRTKTD